MGCRDVHGQRRSAATPVLAFVAGLVVLCAAAPLACDSSEEPGTVDAGATDGGTTSGSDGGTTDGGTTSTGGGGSTPMPEELVPDWLPESEVVKEPIPTTGDYYVAPSGDDANPGTLAEPFLTIQRGVDAAQPGDVILVRAGTYNERVHIQPSHSGTADAYVTLAAYPGEEAVVDGTGISVPDAQAGLITVEGSYVRVSGFTVQDVAGTASQMGIRTIWGSSHIVIDDNYTIRTASAGIGVWYSDSVLVRGNRIQDGRTTGTQECLAVNGSTHFELSFNEVWNTQDWSQRCEGIDVKNGSAVGKVVGNVAHDLPLECFYVDGYAEHTYDIELYANHGYRCSMGLAMTSEQNGLLENIRVFNNLFHDTSFIGIGFPSWSGSTNQGQISNVEIFNNTIDNRRVEHGVNPTGLFFNYPSLDGVMVKNNIIATKGTAFVFESSVTNLEVGYNLVDAAELVSGN
ncbi:MAG: right-handed parallel beta-helix repeat-containing protein, partial [Deltaproteobacteria bacterium]|nr:right-handed parallel beta-helix repeat-containing protein [Deltaproteobacteria bacterium]MBW2531824.1 right-handed parallel beta-helix repeat-containing protein [Deltaproteobacteria bacterium]